MAKCRWSARSDVLGEQNPEPEVEAYFERDSGRGRERANALQIDAEVSQSLQQHVCRAYKSCGEVGGVLEEALQRLSHFLEKDMELRRKVKAALTYPAIVVVVAILIVLGLCTFIVPKFVELFKDLGVKELC